MNFTFNLIKHVYSNFYHHFASTKGQARVYSLVTPLAKCFAGWHICDMAVGQFNNQDCSKGQAAGQQ